MTQTLLASGARAVSEATITLPSFLDFCALSEAVVLLDDLRVMDSAEEPTGLPLAESLLDAGLIRTFAPSLSAVEIERVMLLLPDDVTRLFGPEFGGTAIVRGARAGENRQPDEVDAAGAIRTLDYDRGLDLLVDQVASVVTYPSASADPRQRVLRSATYLLVAAAHGLDYFPDYDRAPFVAGVVRRLYRSLSMQVYDRVSQALDFVATAEDDLVSEWSLDAQLPIPPVAALVLGRSQSRAEIPGRLLEVRDEFTAYRQHLAAFREKLKAADTLRARRKLEKEYRSILDLAAGPRPELISASEVLNMVEKTAAVVANPISATSYSATLVAQPLEWLRRWWKQRPLAVMFRLDSKLPRLSEYRTLVERLWSANVSDELVRQYLRHADQVKALYEPRLAHVSEN